MAAVGAVAPRLDCCGAFVSQVIDFLPKQFGTLLAITLAKYIYIFVAIF